MDADLEAIDRCLAGEQEAFAELVERHKNVVYSIARRMLRNNTEAEDCAQEAFIKAYTSLGDFRREASFRNWLCRIATHICIDKIRAARKEKGRADEQEVEEVAGPDMQESFAAREQIDAALQKIPEDYQAVLILRHMEGMSYQDIAETLKQPLGTVKTHLKRGREALRKEMEKFAQEEAQIYKQRGEA